MHYLLALPKLSRMMPVEFFLHQLFHVHISSTVTHRFVVIARICWNVWIWPWMGFNWNMLLASGKSCIKKTLGFGRVKSPVRYLSLLKVTHFHKKKLNASKANSMAFQLVFPFLLRRSKWPCLVLIPCIGHDLKLYIYIYVDNCRYMI